MEERIARKDDLVCSVLHEPGDAVLSVARVVYGLHGNAPEFEALSVAWRSCHLLAVFPAKDLQIWHSEGSSLRYS